jgi:cardiolipin synthase
MVNYNYYRSLGGELVNVPNILTVLRFLLIPVFAYFLCTKQYAIAVALFLAGGLTDVLDGYIARRYNLITSWGKIADPMADKLMQMTALVILSLVIKIIPPELLAIILIKEVLMGIGALVLYKQDNYVVSANWYGKMATVVFYLAIVMLIFGTPFNQWILFGLPFNQLFFLLAVLAALFAFFMYVRSYKRIKQDKGRGHA